MLIDEGRRSCSWPIVVTIYIDTSWCSCPIHWWCQEEHLGTITPEPQQKPQTMMQAWSEA